MPPIESLDPALILDDWTNRVSNFPEEIKFIQDEIADKDRQVADCIKLIEERDGRIQKWIKANGSHELNPREDSYRQTIRENYDKADQLSVEKIALTQRLSHIMDKHIRHLDAQIKMLYDRSEPGFTDPDDLPSLLRPSAANHSAPSARSINPAANPITAALAPQLNSVSAATAARAAHPQIRNTQTQQHPSSSAPTSPAASMIIKDRQVRESSAGPGSGAPKRGPRINLALGNLPGTSSNLVRHSSLGPGTPKGHTATGAQRAGSAGPRAGTKGMSGPGRKAGTPSGSINRKKGNPALGPKSGLSRVIKRAGKNSPSSNADSDMSDPDSASGDESDARTAGSHRKTPGGPRPGEGGEGGHNNHSSRHPHHTKREENDDEDMAYLDDDEAGDDKKYCLCQKVSFGDMVACDNEDCPYEWFHWSCVGLRSEPTGTWFCPECTANMGKKSK